MRLFEHFHDHARFMLLCLPNYGFLTSPGCHQWFQIRNDCSGDLKARARLPATARDSQLDLQDAAWQINISNHWNYFAPSTSVCHVVHPLHSQLTQAVALKPAISVQSIRHVAKGLPLSYTRVGPLVQSQPQHQPSHATLYNLDMGCQ